MGAVRPCPTSRRGSSSTTTGRSRCTPHGLYGDGIGEAIDALLARWDRPRVAGRGAPVDVTTVAFDLMDTVVRDPYREALAAATGLPVEQLFARRDASAYPALERGELAEADYWAAYRTAGIEVDVDAFHAVRRAGYRWVPGMRELLADLEGQVRLVVASNYPLWIEEVAEGFIAGVFDDVHASCHLGVRKPDGAFFVRLLDRLDAAPEEVAFVDDREVNVQGARAVGLPAHRFEAAPALRAWLRDRGLDV